MSAIASRRPVPLWAKILAAVIVTAAADVLFFDQAIGATLGGFCLGLVAVIAILRPDVRRSARGIAALSIAAALALLQVEHPTFLGWLLFAAELSTAVLWSRAGAADDAWRWAQRLATLAAKGAVGPLLDGLRLRKARRRRGKPRLAAVAGLVALPAIGGVLFFALFAAANPLISQAVTRIAWPEPSLARVLFWAGVLIAAWGWLRPRFLARPLPTPSAAGDLRLPGVTVASVTLSLVVFNLVFAVQNGLDLVFLWSGAPLPDNVTLAEYAHRGAFTLMVTAVLAGLFVLTVLAPGSRTAASRLVRWLVVLWIAQNLVLVASSILRTLDYVDAYSLTRMRIVALLWMGLVALGLVLICWRMLRNLSASWLINANALAAAVVLVGCAVADLGSVAAAWNVRHAREVGGRGAALDLCYLDRIGAPAAVSLAELERRPLAPEFLSRVRSTRVRAEAELARSQSDWRAWSWRAERRLRRVRALTGPGGLGRDPCAGTIYSDF